MSYKTPLSTTTVVGNVELATDAESYLLADTSRALTPSNVGAVLAVEQQSGFQEWTGAGSHYTVAGTNFTLDRPGIGWVNSKRVTWLGTQTLLALAAGSTHFVYIDSAGTIGSTTTRSTALFQNNIVLFEVLVDSGGVAAVIVVKENHSLQTHPSTMNALHELGMHGYDVVGPSGGTIALHGTLGIQVIGTTEWHDHDLATTIPDSAAGAITMNIMYTNGAGKWVRQSAAAVLPTQYNLAGTPTALAGNERTIFEILVSKDDIESAAPQYFAVMDDAKYANLATATVALNNRAFAMPTNELQALELIHMGYVIMNATQIDSVTVDKETVGGGSTVINTSSSSASSVTVDTTNFDGWLSAADTTVQAALETLDDTGKDGTFALQNTAAPTKLMNFNLASITAGNTRTITMADQAISLISTTGSFQASDATLTALAAFNTNGFLVQTAADTFAGRTLQAGAGISITNPAGTAGDPTITSTVSPIMSNLNTAVAYADWIDNDTSAGTHKFRWTDTILFATPVQGHPGVTVNNNSGACVIEGQPIFNTYGELTFAVVARLDQALEASDTLWFGFSDTTSADISTYNIAFRAIGAAANWIALTENNTTETATNTGVAVDTDWHEYKIVVNSAGTETLFYIDGVLEATNNTNMPSAAIDLFPIFYCKNIPSNHVYNDAILVTNTFASGRY